MLVRMKLTTTVIPIINTLVIDILIEATTSIAGILLFFHCFQYSWEKRNVKYGISIGLDHVSFVFLLQIFNIAWMRFNLFNQILKLI